MIIENEREVIQMALINEVLCNCKDPCSYYKEAWTWFQNGDLSLEAWNAFTMACLESLMKKNKDVLDRLKNC